MFSLAVFPGAIVPAPYHIGCPLFGGRVPMANVAKQRWITKGIF